MQGFTYVIATNDDKSYRGILISLLILEYESNVHWFVNYLLMEFEKSLLIKISP